MGICFGQKQDVLLLITPAASVRIFLFCRVIVGPGPGNINNNGGFDFIFFPIRRPDHNSFHPFMPGEKEKIRLSHN